MKKYIYTKEECLALCKKMASKLNGEWKFQPSDISKSVVRDTDWYAIISNGEVYILHNAFDGSYSAAYEGMSYELESWDGRTPKEALSKLIKSRGNSIKAMEKELEELKKAIPEAKKNHAKMLNWIKKK